MDSKKSRRYDGVIFDLDGTLLDTLTDLTDSLNAVLTQYGLAGHTREAVCRFVGNGIRKLIERAVPDGTSDPEYEAIYGAFQEYYGMHCMEATAPYPGILSLLDWLQREGYRIAIVSNKADFAVKKLNQSYFGKWIPVAIGERAGIRKKPAPDTVMQALQELGVSRERAVYIGDSDVDIETAHNAGMDIISVSWGFRSRDFLLEHGARAEWIAADAEAVRALIECG